MASEWGKDMARRSDKWFHLTISAFAIALTAVASGTLVYEHNPEQVQSWIHALSHMKSAQSPSSDHRSEPPADTSHRVQPTNATVSSNGTTPLPTPHVDAAEAVHVTAYGHDVPVGKVKSVNQLLSDYHIVDTVFRTLQMSTSGPVHIYLAQNATDYKDALNSLGVSVQDAQRYSQDTGGFTMGRDIVVPLYQNTSNADLANTLAHELTHAFLNAYLNANVDNLPSWVNEGLAVYNGMKVQAKVENPVSYGGYARQMAESVMKAAVSGNLVPLAKDEAQVLAGNASYDLELQDWLAISYLAHQHGEASLAKYLQAMKQGMSSDAAFQAAFGGTPAALNSTLSSLLKQAGRTSDDGVAVTVKANPSFQGYIRVLQHGNTVWHGVKMSAGQEQLMVLPNGTLQGNGKAEDTTQDKNPPDDITTYMDLDPDKPLYYNGKAVSYCGFALDYHYGMYGFVNAWVTLNDGKSIYLEDPSLFGVTVTSVVEVDRKNPILPLLQAAP